MPSTAINAGDSGPTAGGQTVTITGTNLGTTGTTIVTFGGLSGNEATNVVVTRQRQVSSLPP